VPRLRTRGSRDGTHDDDTNYPYSAPTQGNHNAHARPRRHYYCRSRSTYSLHDPRHNVPAQHHTTIASRVGPEVETNNHHRVNNNRHPHADAASSVVYMRRAHQQVLKGGEESGGKQTPGTQTTTTHGAGPQAAVHTNARTHTHTHKNGDSCENSTTATYMTRNRTHTHKHTDCAPFTHVPR
jgi:hypothetical protein